MKYLRDNVSVLVSFIACTFAAFLLSTFCEAPVTQAACGCGHNNCPTGCVGGTCESADCPPGGCDNCGACGGCTCSGAFCSNANCPNKKTCSQSNCGGTCPGGGSCNWCSNRTTDCACSGQSQPCPSPRCGDGCGGGGGQYCPACPKYNQTRLNCAGGTSCSTNGCQGTNCICGNRCTGAGSNCPAGGKETYPPKCEHGSPACCKNPGCTCCADCKSATGPNTCGCTPCDVTNFKCQYTLSPPCPVTFYHCFANPYILSCNNDPVSCGACCSSGCLVPSAC